MKLRCLKLTPIATRPLHATGYGFIKLIIFLQCLMLLTACGGSNDDLHKYVEQTLKKPGSRIEPLPKLVPYEPHRYSSAAAHSPFEPPKKIVIKNNIQPDTKRPKEELETYALDSLQMVGTFSRNHKLWALVSAPNGVIYRVTIGNYLGKNYGRIEKIDKDYLEMQETVNDGQGNWTQKNIKLDLATKDKAQ